MQKNKIEITKAKCERCKRNVNPEASFSQMWNGKQDFIYNVVYTYWSCEGCGAVGAYVGKKYYQKPIELFDEILFESIKVKLKNAKK